MSSYPLGAQQIAAMALDLVQRMDPDERAHVAEAYSGTSTADDADIKALTYKIRQLAAENRSAPTGRDSRIPAEYSDCPYEYDDPRYVDWCSVRNVIGIGRVYRVSSLPRDERPPERNRSD